MDKDIKPGRSFSIQVDVKDKMRSHADYEALMLYATKAISERLRTNDFKEYSVTIGPYTKFE